jgi:Ca-activated chloride channel homolog
VDYGGFLLSLESLAADTIPKGGTSISSAIKEAMRSFPGGNKKSQVMVIITDGEDHDGDPVSLAEEARKQGIIIHCIGIGTREGDLIFIEEAGAKEFLKDSQGNAVKSRLDEEVLQKIALATGGTYIRSTNTEFGLDLLYKEKLSAMEKSESAGKMNKRYEERYQIFLALGFLLIVAEMFVRDYR